MLIHPLTRLVILQNGVVDPSSDKVVILQNRIDDPSSDKVSDSTEWGC